VSALWGEGTRFAGASEPTAQMPLAARSPSGGPGNDAAPRQPRHF
jgi:hypothetical protein